jgi:Zn-dependent peptidase ImmA (M78 family)
MGTYSPEYNLLRISNRKWNEQELRYVVAHEMKHCHQHRLNHLVVINNGICLKGDVYTKEEVEGKCQLAILGFIEPYLALPWEAEANDFANEFVGLTKSEAA